MQFSRFYMYYTRSQWCETISDVLQRKLNFNLAFR